MADATDTELLAAARAGDRRALEGLLERHQGQVYRFGMTLCRDPEDAAEVLQNTLLAMAESVGDFRGASSLSTWLYSIARSHCVKQRRKSKFAPRELWSLEAELEGAAEPPGTDALPDEVLAQKQIRQAVGAALAQLEPEQREVLVLRDMEGLTAAEVAEVMSTSVPAVKSRLHRARARLRDTVAATLGRTERPREQCPDVVPLFSRYLEGDIDAQTCERLQAHVDQCAHCRPACELLKQTLAACRTGAVAEVPDDVQQAVRAALHRFLATSKR